MVERDRGGWGRRLGLQGGEMICHLVSHCYIWGPVVILLYLNYYFYLSCKL